MSNPIARFCNALRTFAFTAIAMTFGGEMAIVAAAPATAATVQWSGLDVRDYRGPIPAAGNLITSVPLEAALSVAGAGQAYRILYSTTNQHDSPAVSTAAVFLPLVSAPGGGFPVIAWAHGTVGISDACTPSALPRSHRDDDYLSHWLGQGYAIVASDYSGLGTPGLMSYLDSTTTAHGIIDSVVAAQQMNLPLAPAWALVGQSQGAGAAISSARWATEFTAGTSLDFRGVVATGTPAGIDELVAQAGPKMTLPHLDPVANAYTAYLLAALREARPELGIDSVLSADGLRAIEMAHDQCVDQLRDHLVHMTIADFFSAPLRSIPGMAEALREYVYTPTTGYDRPIFLGVGLQDVDVPPTSTLTFYNQLRAHNQDVVLRTYPNDDHDSTVMASTADSTLFLSNAFQAG